MLLVEPVTPDVPAVEPLELLSVEEPVVPPVEPLPVLEPLPAPGPPIELVLPVVPPLLPVVVSLFPAVLPVDGVVAALPDDGLVVVVLLEELDVGGALASRFVQAPSDRAATTVSAAAAHCVRDIFIRKLLEGLFGKWQGQP